MSSYRSINGVEDDMYISLQYVVMMACELCRQGKGEEL